MSLRQKIPLAFRQIAKKPKDVQMIQNWHIVRGDKVEVLSGPHKGQQGVVSEVIRKKNQVVLDGINMRQRCMKATAGASGKMYMAPSPIHYSNVNLVDPSLGKPTRVAMRFLDDGTKVRVSKKSGTIIPKPEILKERQRPRQTETGLLDTSPELAIKRTVEDWEIKL